MIDKESQHEARRLAIVFVCMMSLGACDSGFQDRQNQESDLTTDTRKYDDIFRSDKGLYVDPDPLPVSRMRTAIFSPDFAQRFGYAQEEAHPELGNGLLALEFFVERYMGGTRDIYSCGLKAYIDSSLPVRFPQQANNGSMEGLGQGHHFFANNRFDKWRNGEERTDFIQLSSQYTRTVYIATPNFMSGEERSAGKSVGVDRYYEEIVPRIDYIELNVGCTLFGLEEDYGGEKIQLWLVNAGGRDYTRVAMAVPEDFTKLDVPEEFLSDILPIMHEVKMKNNQLREFARNHREWQSVKEK